VPSVPFLELLPIYFWLVFGIGVERRYNVSLSAYSFAVFWPLSEIVWVQRSGAVEVTELTFFEWLGTIERHHTVQAALVLVLVRG
jgi:hypothetical protein